jgi:hypothetical protein
MPITAKSRRDKIVACGCHVYYLGALLPFTTTTVCLVDPRILVSRRRWMSTQHRYRIPISAQRAGWRYYKGLRNVDTLTFDEVWEKSQNIHGHFANKCAHKLFHYAMICNPGSEFVEIGSFCGKSASILGQVAMAHGCRLTLVDNFAMQPGAEQLLKNLSGLGIAFELMAMPSAQAAPLFTRPIDLIHIDGGHHLIEEDCTLWLPKLQAGGWALFHDWGQGFRLIMDTVNALEGYEDFGVFASLAIRRKHR